jgi:hypothetical protein
MFSIAGSASFAQIRNDQPAKYDSISKVNDSTQNKFGNPLNDRVLPSDSLKKKITEYRGTASRKKSKITSLSSKANPVVLVNTTASKVKTPINATKKLNQYNKRLAKYQHSLTHKIDSLNKLSKKNPDLSNQSKTLQHKLDSLKRAGPFKDVQQAEAKMKTLESGVNSKLTAVQNGVNGKLNRFNQNGAKIPGLSLPKLNTGFNANTMPGTNLPNSNLSLPSNPLGNTGGFNMPQIGNASGLGSGQLQTPAFNTNPLGSSTNSVGNFGNLSSPNLSNIPGLDGMKNVEKEMGQVGKVSKEVEGYQKDIANVSKGDLDKVKKLPGAIESKAEGMKEIKGLQAKELTMEQQQEMAKKWESDPEYRKELALNKAKEQTTNYFAGHDKELMAAMNKMTQLKSKTKDAEMAVDMFKKQGNPMTDRTFRSRLVPGFALQIQKKGDNLWLDFNPYLGYRISGRFTSGIGWNERVSINVKKVTGVASDRIYGPRSFLNFKVKESFYLRGEAELMNVNVVPSATIGPENAGRQWVPSYLAGVKKDFRYSSHVIGNVQLLYNLYNPNHMSPYLSKFNVRMGIEFPAKRKVRTPKTASQSAGFSAAQTEKTETLKSSWKDRLRFKWHQLFPIREKVIASGRPSVANRTEAEADHARVPAGY